MLILDFALESLDQVHRIYEAEESFDILHMLVNGKLFITLFGMQMLLGTLIPLIALGTLQVARIGEKVRKTIYFSSGILVLIGIFFMRYNVVIGGQLFSKSLRGLTVYKMELLGLEGLLMGGFLLLLPLAILGVLIAVLPPWPDREVSAQDALQAA